MARMAPASAAWAPFASLAPSAARTFLIAVRMAVLCAMLRAVRLIRCRFAFSDDLMFATAAHHDEAPGRCQGEGLIEADAFERGLVHAEEVAGLVEQRLADLLAQLLGRS